MVDGIYTAVDPSRCGDHKVGMVSGSDDGWVNFDVLKNHNSFSATLLSPSSLVVARIRLYYFKVVKP